MTSRGRAAGNGRIGQARKNGLSSGPLQACLLGEFACHAVGGERLVFPTRKVEALLAYLAANPGRRHPRSRLAAMLWEELPEDRARANFRKTLSRLQQSLPEGSRSCLSVDAHEVSLSPDGVELDIDLFERLSADGTPETLERALALYRGPFLDGLADCGEAFEQWMSVERRRIAETLQQVLRRLLRHYVVTGAVDAAILLALRLLAIDSLDEDAHRTLMRLYMYQDRIGAALEQYGHCRRLLADELGVDPAPETDRLRAELLGLVPRDEDEDGAPPREDDTVPEKGSVIQAAAAMRGRRRRSGSAAQPSIAVLAFTLEDGAPNWRHLSGGMAEDIATELGRFRELEVIAPATTLAYRDAGAAPQRIGDELGAGFVLAGSLRCRGQRLRTTARLVESGTGRQVWAERYDCDLADVFEVQDDVVSRIVGSLVETLESEHLARTRSRHAGDWQVYELWLRGQSALRSPHLSAIREARRYFQQAIARDPGYARAYVGLALAHLNEWTCFAWNHWTFAQREALDLARKAVSLDARDHRARCMLALAELYGRRYDAAHGELLTALELNPNDTDVLAHASFALALIGDSERAVDAGRKALRLAPHHPDWYAGMAGIALFSARHYREAVDTLASAPEAFCNTPAFTAASYAHLGQPQEGASHRDTVYRHYRYQLARGGFPSGFSCLEWLAALDPYQHAVDADHYLDGLRRAGFA